MDVNEAMRGELREAGWRVQLIDDGVERYYCVVAPPGARDDFPTVDKFAIEDDAWILAFLWQNARVDMALLVQRRDELLRHAGEDRSLRVSRANAGFAHDVAGNHDTMRAATTEHRRAIGRALDDYDSACAHARGSFSDATWLLFRQVADAWQQTVIRHANANVSVENES